MTRFHTYPDTGRSRYRARCVGLAVAFGLGLVVPGTLGAQVAVGLSTCPGGAAQIGDLGVDFDCEDCGLAYDGATRSWRWRFRSEPTVANVGRSGPSAGKLQEGDVVVSIDQALITTRRGGAMLASLEPNVPITVVVRRGGREQTHRVRPAAACATDAPAPGQGFRGDPFPRPPMPPLPATVPEPPSSAPLAGPVAVPRPPLLPPGLRLGTRAWFGFGLSCSDCSLRLVHQEEIEVLESEVAAMATSGELQLNEVEGLSRRIEALREDGYQWSFEEYPRIFSVDDDGPADEAGLRRGDLLTHIDGLSLLSEEGGKHLGQVRPGQRVEVVYQRGTTVGTARLEVATAPRPYGEAARAAYLRSLALMSSSLGRLQQTQDPEVRAEVSRLQAQLEAAQTERRVAAIESIRAHQSVAYPLRYSGVIAKVNVTVRSRASVVVSRDEETGEVVITTSDATVRVKPEER